MSTSQQGTSGIHRSESAAGHHEGAFTLLVGEDFFVAKNLFGTAGDEDQFMRTRVHLAWDPIAHLQVMLGGSFTANTYKTFYSLTRTQLGNPQAAVKGYLQLSDAWQVGAMAGIFVPTSVNGASLQFGASSPTLTLIGTWRPQPVWQVSLNLAATLDRTATQIAQIDGPLFDEQRLTFGIWNHSHAAWSLGAQRELPLLSKVPLAAFVEAHQDVPLAGEDFLAPLRLGAGARATFGQDNRLELRLGADARLVGKSHPGALQPAQPPWQLYASLALQLGASRSPSAGTDALFAPPARPRLLASTFACTWDVDCTFGRTCQDGECRPPPPPARQEAPAVKPKTYSVLGTVHDSETHQPVADAYVELKGFPDTRLMVDARTGTFRTWQLSFEEDIEATAYANGYLPTRVRIKPFETHKQLRITFTLRPDPKSKPVTVRGLLRDRIWGTPVHGQALVTAQNRVIKADRTGAFEFTLQSGRYEVILVAPGYVTQRKQLIGQAGETVIFNVDMEPFSTRRQQP